MKQIKSFEISKLFIYFCTMEIVGTKEAFKKLLEVPAIYKYLGVDTSTVANWKRYMREGKLISTDKMEEMLMKFGAKVKQEKVWEVPIKQQGMIDEMDNNRGVMVRLIASVEEHGQFAEHQLSIFSKMIFRDGKLMTDHLNDVLTPDYHYSTLKSKPLTKEQFYKRFKGYIDKYSI